MSYDVAAIREQFPALAEGAAHFDGPGGTQVPHPVARAVADTLRSAVSNRGRLTRSERRADDIVVEAREAMGDLVGADPQGVVFGRSMTQLTYDFSRALAKTWGPGDEVVVTRLDHDANVRPWVQAAAAAGASVRWADFDPDTGELSVEQVSALLSDRTRLVAMTAASNLLGTRPPVSEIARAVHDVGALFYLDGVHATPHVPIDMDDAGADFFACSPYKFFGPHCGVVAARPEVLTELAPDKLLPSPERIPERFELGTLPYELLAGTSATVNFIASLGELAGGGSGQATARRQRIRDSMRAVEAYEKELLGNLESRLREVPALRTYSRAGHRTPTLLLDIEGRDAAETAGILAERGVNAPAGSFYALEPSRRLGIGNSGAVRVGLAPYTDADDLDRLVEGLRAAADH